ncbi:coiled-coil domain-containing protein 93-like [Amphibalanus amphitrite]|uniref:coiled-coil domain-containing protein 93-like n=1 Tax=Amphibalanus amphitrite TaxID=1232801 RepID=UPI001C90A582|nr:coiled-coil domain-containing protein 93-like [Amphibalanus amphitrite]
MAAFQLQADVRDDEEQQTKYQECLDLLLAAGYFRARIRGLSPFDKLVGGMVWCIEMCSLDVDVDLFYKDELTIGQKIGVTERIIEVLPKMSCPHRIEPHQIQGLDCVHIYAVMQWLVKKALENQAETTSHTLGHGVFQFNQRQPTLAPSQPAANRALVQLVEERFCPVSQPRDRRADQPGEEAPDLITESEPSLQPDVQAVSAMLGMGEIQRAAEAYQQQSRQLQESGLDADQHGRLLVALADRQTETERRRAAVQHRLQRLQARRQRLQQEQEQLAEERDALAGQEAALTAGLTPEQAVTLEAILTSFKEADTILSEDQAFKEECKAEYAKLQDEISRLQESVDGRARSDPDTEREVLKQTVVVDGLRTQVAAVSRQVALLERQLDDVPSRAEIAQYQKRFVELYNQVNSTHKEAKEHYATNNLLSDTLRYLENELALLNSVSENYAAARGSAQGRADFLQQLDAIVFNVRSNQNKVLVKKQAEKRTLDALMAELDQLRALSRTYQTVLKQFRDECALNETLTSAGGDGLTQ